MERPRRIDPLVVKRAQLTATTTTSVESLRQCQAVLLPALFGATLEQTAAVLGVGRATVPRLQAAFASTCRRRANGSATGVDAGNPSSPRRKKSRS